MKMISKVEFGLRDLSADEIAAVAGAGWEDTNGNGYFDEGDILNNITPTTSGGGGGGFDSFGLYSSVGFGYGGAVGGVSHVYGGDSYVYLGAGSPGPSAAAGIDLDGDLSGATLTANPGGATVPIDPSTLSASGVEYGTRGSELTYSFNISEIGRELYDIVENFADAFVDNYYPDPYPQ